MRTPHTQPGAALAADLLVDLESDVAAPAQQLASPAQQIKRATSVAQAATERPRPSPVGEVSQAKRSARGPAVQGALRLAPFDWHKPTLALRPDRIAVRLGPIYAELAFGPS